MVAAPRGKMTGTAVVDPQHEGTSFRVGVGEHPPGARASWGSVVTWVYCGASLVLIAYYLSSAAGLMLVPLVMGTATLTAVVVGPLAYRPRHRSIWVMMALAVVFWLLGAALRGQQIGGAPLISDLFTLPGYALVLGAYLKLLRRRGVTGPNGATLDGLVLGVSAILLMWRSMVEPLLAGTSVSPRQLVFDLIYPVIDIALLLILAQLSFTDVSRTPAYWFFAVSLGGLLTGDLLWNAAAAGEAVGVRTVTLPYLVAYGTLGASACHPSMRRLTTAQRVQEALPLPRALILAIALSAPTALTALWPAASMVDRLLAAATGLGLSLLVLIRTARAANAYAREADRFEYSATHDELTGLPNRRLLMESVKDLLEKGDKTPIVFFLDLDAFKLINDSWGHEVGDELLVQVSSRLKQMLASDGQVARIGGDEFVVLAQTGAIVDGVPETAIEHIGRRLLDVFADSFTISPGEVFVTPSIGVAWPYPGRARGNTALESREVVVELLRDADTAMYDAKARGRGQLSVFDLPLRERVRGRLDLENSFRRAMGTDQLTLAYQPLIDLATGRLIGWEALARWDCPDRGPISPADFIPVAERTDLIFPFGEWVLEEALSQLVTWRTLLDVHDLGGHLPHLHVAVNVASRQLHDANLVGIVRDALRRFGLPGNSLCVEITESAIIDDSVCSARIGELRMLGCSVAVDDFGTGYSALGYLKRFPVTEVKIDRSFVSGLETSPDDTAIVKAVVAMAQALGLDLVAEGVETEAQARILQDLGCDTGQGYFFGRPISAAAAGADLLARAREAGERCHSGEQSGTNGPVRSMP